MYMPPRVFQHAPAAPPNPVGEIHCDFRFFKKEKTDVWNNWMHVVPDWKEHKVRIRVDSSGAFSKDPIIFYSDPEGSVGTPHQGHVETNGEVLNLWFSEEGKVDLPPMHSLILRGGVFDGFDDRKADIQMRPIGAWKLRADYTYEEIHDARTVCMTVWGGAVLPHERNDGSA